MLNILFTSVGNLAFPTVYFNLKKSFTEFKIVGTDVRENAHGLYYCNKKYLVDYRSSPNFLKQINHIIKKEEINILCPLSTEDQDYFSDKKEEFLKQGVIIVCSNKESIKNVNNKFLLYTESNKAGLPTPGFHNLNDHSSFEEMPFVVKPYKGTGGASTRIIGKNKADLRADDQKFFQEFDEFKKSKFEKDTLICEYLPGDEYSVDTLSYNGKFYYGVVRKRYASTGGLALEAETVRDDYLLDLAKKYVSLFSLSYINNIQFKKDKNGIAKIMEINPRIPGTLKLSIASGFDFISDSIKLALKKEIKKPETIVYGTKIIRFFDGVIIPPNTQLIDMRTDQN